MSLRFEEQANFHCFFVTTTFSKHAPLGTIPGCYAALASALVFCLKKYGAGLAAYAFMPTHIHLLLFLPGKSLGDFMRDFKKFTAQKGIKELGVRCKPVWQAGFDRVAIDNEKAFLTKLNYIHNNPIRANPCSTIDEWTWSSAAEYSVKRHAPVPIDKGWMG